MSVEQAYYLSVALINLVFAIAGSRVKEPEGSTGSVLFFILSFLAYFVSWFVYVFDVTTLVQIIGAITASAFVWGMVVFSAIRCSFRMPWYVPTLLFLIQCALQSYTIFESNFTAYLHVSGVMLPFAFGFIAYLFLKRKKRRNPSDVAFGYAYIIMAIVLLGRSVLLEVSPEIFAKSSLYTQIIWPAFCTAIGVFALLSYTEEVQGRLEKESNTDLLTGLANRRMFNWVLSKSLASLSRSNSYGALIYFDLDGFKPINDQYGHYVGDQVLSEIGLRLKAFSRSDEIAARLGGDEFALLLIRGECDLAEMKQQAEQLATRIQKLIKMPIQCDGYTIQVASSAGIHIIKPDEESSEAVMNAADNAMYHSKGDRVGGLTFSDTLVEPEYAIARVGVRDIDFEHQEIDELLHNLLNQDRVQESELIEFHRKIKQHFSSEEKISVELGLNMTREHRQDHGRILRILNHPNVNETQQVKEYLLSVGKIISTHSFAHDRLLNRLNG